MSTLSTPVSQWLIDARNKIRDGGLQDFDLDQLQAFLERPLSGLRQRLLYLHASGTSIHSLVIAADPQEPLKVVPPPNLTPNPQMPYHSVRDAIVDGWRVVHFPRQTALVEDREVGMIGYEFILEKLEEYDAGQ